jgi:glycosyltransferase involved in cell wall biosynthesis
MTFLFFVSGEIIGGKELVLRSLMSQIVSLGHRVIAIVSVWNDSIYPRMLDHAGIEHHEIRLGRIYLSNPNWTRGTLKALPDSVRTIRRITADLQPDWVIFDEPQSLLLCSATIPRRKRVLYLHAVPDHLMSHRLWGRLIARQVDRTLCVSEFVARSARATPLQRTPITVVENGTDAPDVDRPLIQRRPLRLGIVGRVTPQKQHRTVLRAMALLVTRLPRDHIHLDIVGAATSQAERDLQAEIARLDLSRLVTRRGFVEDRSEIYSGLDIVMAPAIDEGFGMTALEAAAFGLPVVAARSGGLPEVVLEETTGLLFEPGDAEGLARSLERLILDREFGHRLGQVARARVRAAFTMEKMAKRFLAALGGS